MDTYRRVYKGKEPSTKIEIHKAEKTKEICSAKEEEQAIASMGIEELKAYACPKSLQHKNDWYMVCISCAGLSTCKIGRRVVEILEQTTKPEELVSPIDKFNARIQKTVKTESSHSPVVHNGGNNRYALVGKQAYITALAQPDPIGYIAEKNGTSRESASRRLHKWKLQYPDVPIPDKNENMPTHKDNEYIRKRKEETRQKFIAAATYSKGPLLYMEEILGYSSATRSKELLKRWAAKYSDIEAQYHIFDWLKAHKNDGCKKPGRKAKDKEQDQSMEVAKPEEISIQDFLKEVDDGSEEKQEENIETEDPVSMHPTSMISENIIKSDSFNKIAACTIFSEKRKEFINELDYINTQIELLQKQKTEIYENLKTLDAAAKIIGFEVDDT